jgi:glyoxylase-like metal-dependent hydrolase (beta-lactamase superfamily II)
MIIVRWSDESGTNRTLLWEPSDVELDANTPYFASLRRRSPKVLSDRVVKNHGTVAEGLASFGIDAAEIDYIAFDHLHTQDVRRLIGTTKPQLDISPNHPVVPALPNARLIVQSQELKALSDLHPIQKPWYQPETYVDLDPDRLLSIDGDRLIGPGVAIVRTPGHATGNQTLLLNTTTGVWALSENVIAAECLTPEHSKIPGVARWARKWEQEVVINANTVEATATQYNSCVLEKMIVDRSASDSRFLQFFPTSELTFSAAAPGIHPTFAHREIKHQATFLSKALG